MPDFKYMTPTVPENVAIRDVQTYDTSAFVEWDTKPQHTCSAVVTFTVFYELHEGALLSEFSANWCMVYTFLYILHL